MGNFGKVLSIALQQRWTVLAILATSLLVAVLWGGNIGALYPIIKVSFSGRSLHEWLGDEIAKSEQLLGGIDQQIRQLERTAAGQEGGMSSVQRRALRSLAYERSVQQRALTAAQRLQPWVDRLLPKDPFQTVVWIVLAVLVGTALKGAAIFLNLMLVAQLEQRVTFEVRRKFFHQALRMDLATIGHHRTSGLLSHFHADISHIAGGIKTLFGSALREPLKMAACLAGAAWISWRLLLFSLLLTPLVVISIRWLAQAIKRANRRALEEISQLYGVLTEAFNGLQTVQAYTLEQSERIKFHRVAKECLRKGMKISLYSALAKPVTEILGIGMICLALLAGAYLTLNEQTHILGMRMSDRPLDIASLLVFYGLLIGATEPARKLSDVFGMVQAGSAAADRVLPWLEQVPTIQDPGRPRSLPRAPSHLRFQAVRFAYDPGRPALIDIDFELAAGETLAIVGPNGCGKSTLCHLVPRFIDPASGAILLGGVDIRELRLRDLRRRIGFVTQRAVLFDDTVEANIRCGRHDATLEDVVRAAKQARAHRFIEEKLVDGYQTKVGTGGEKLSGGQRQRIALARAMIRDPELLILDEATSQIDLESEQLICQALEEFCHQRSVIMITHRLSLLSLADRILVMHAGRLEDLGTHAELMQRCDVYQRLHQLQFQRCA
jgi:ATP-binding cassette, subfamily B, bacterial MsbA